MQERNVRPGLVAALKPAAALAVAAGLSIAGCSSPGPQQAASPPVVKQASVNGVRLTYQEQGNGEPVVLVHGAVSDHRVWDQSRAPLAARYRFVALTQRYFGTEPWPDDGGKFSVGTHADDLAAFIRQLGVGPVHVVGWSYGGAVQFLMATRHPELVKSLFSYEPHLPSIVTEPAARKAFEDDIGAVFGPVVAHSSAGNQAAAVEAMIDGVNAAPGAFGRMPATQRALHLDNARTVPLALADRLDAPSCAELGRIRAPVTIAYGGSTRTWFRVHTQEAGRCLPAARLVMVPQAGHGLPVQDPAAFQAVLLDHLRQR